MFLSCLSVVAFAQPARKTTLSVMDLTYSNIPATEAKLLGDALLSEITDTKVYQVVERSQRDEILREQGFAQSGACDETSCLIEAGKLLAVQKMVGGSIGKIGKNWVINIRVVDVLTGQVEKAFTKYYKGSVDQLLLNMRESGWEIALMTGVTPEVLKEQYMKKPSPILFARFKGTKQKYPSLTYGLGALSVVFGAATFYYYDGASNSYAEYKTAIDDGNILRCKSDTEWKNHRASQMSYVTAACLSCAITNYLIREKKPAESIYSMYMPTLNFAFAQNVSHKIECFATFTLGVGQ